jgi:hypothetical protein
MPVANRNPSMACEKQTLICLVLPPDFYGKMNHRSTPAAGSRPPRRPSRFLAWLGKPTASIVPFNQHANPHAKH